MNNCHHLEWFAVYVRSRAERMAASILEQKRLEVFLPVRMSKRRWSDRMKSVEVPLFPNYVFCRFDPIARLSVLTTSGVISIVGGPGGPLPIEPREIESLRTLVASPYHLEAIPYIPANNKVRIEHGPLAGVEGVVVCIKNRERLVVSVSMLRRSVLAEVDCHSVSDLGPQALGVNPGRMTGRFLTERTDKG